MHRTPSARARPWLALLAGALLAACAETEYRPASSAPDYPPYEGQVEVLQALPPPDRFERLGIIIVKGVSNTSDAAMMRNLTEQAAERGANAVVLQSKIKTTKTYDGGEERKLAAWAIRLAR